MSIKVFNIADFIQQSSWTVEYINFQNQLTSGPTTDTDNKTVSFATIPAGSIINSATLTATIGGTNYTLRTLDGTFFNGSRNVAAKVTAGSSASFEWKFKGSGSTASVGTITSYLAYSNVKVTVDYTEPTSALTLNKTSCKAGDTIRGTITPTSSTATHKMRFYQDASHYFEYTMAAGTNYKDFEVPLDWQNQIPSATTDAITVRLQTYLSGSLTGEVSKTFTMTLSDDNYPTISAFTATRIPGFIDEDITGYVQGFSKANFDVTAAGLYSATISQYRFYTDAWSVTGNDSDSPVLTTSGVRTVTCEVTDSRGRKTTSTLGLTVIPYAPPSLDTPTVYRCDVAGVAAIAGTYVYIDSGIGFSSLGLVEGVEVNETTLKARVYQKGEVAPAWDDVSVIVMTPETPEIESGMNIEKSYIIDIQVWDKLATYPYTTEIPTAKALLTGLAEVAGAGIGLYAERENACTSAWDYWVNDDPVCKYGIGQPYTSKDPTSPATLYPGTTWEALPEGTFPMAGGATYVPGEASGEGGAATHGHTAAGIAKIGVSGTSSWIKRRNQAWTADAKWTINTIAANTDNLSSGAEIGATISTGSNLPPFRAYYMWERTA